MPAAESPFLWFTPGEWTALATCLLAAFTALLVAVGIYQVLAIRAENKKTSTLNACSNYEQNPNIYDALQKLWAALENGDLEREPRKFRPQINVVLNFLDAIAIGIEQGLYLENLAWDHLDAIVKRNVKRFIDSGVIEKVGLEREDFIRLIDMRDRWMRARPRFRDVSWWRRNRTR
jgi:hypothetical protein